MLDLDAGVHFHEVEGLVLVEQHLDRAGADVVDRLCALHCRVAHSFAKVLGERNAWRLLDELLMTALHGAIALAEVDDGAVPVTHDLELDVPRALEILLDVDLT